MAPLRLHRPIRRRWRAAGWTALLVGSAVLIVFAGLAGALRNSQPAAALRFMPGDARALARRAEQSLLSGKPKPASARADARAALARDATIPSAWRTLALVSPDGPAKSVGLFETAERLSRRDMPTQIALLETAVRRGDVAGALGHYDVILRVTSDYDPILLPVLAGAVPDLSVRRALADLLLRAPMWRRRFLAHMISANTPYDVQADLFSAMAKAGPLPDRDIVAAQATASVLGGQYRVGERLYRLVAPTDAGKPLRDGGFEKDNGVPPFDWLLETDGPLDVSIAGSGDGRRLEIASERGDGGRAARQLVSLAPGRHRLMARAGAVDGQEAGRPYMTLTCAQEGGLLASFSGAPNAPGLGGEVTVPQGCGLQWLELGLLQDPSGEGAAAWVDAVASSRSQG